MPSIFAIVAFGIVRMRSTSAWKRPSFVGFGGGVLGSVWISATSAWAMKNSGFALCSTTTRTASSRSSSSPARRRSPISAASKRLIGGWSIVTHAMPPSIFTARHA